MKLLHFYKDGQAHLGIKSIHGVIDVEKTVQQNGSCLPVTFNDILSQCKNNPAYLNQYLDLEPVMIQESEMTYAPSVVAPGKILCVGLNYHSHTSEIHFEQPKIPTLFSKFTDSLVGHQAEIRLPKEAYKFDYEVELVIVMGKTAHNVSKEEAANYIFGYSLGNDFSARDLQMVTGQWLVGKACDDFAPLGPYLVTADEIDSSHLEISSKVNGELRQSSNTSNMIFDCASIISYISQYITLRPGDIIYTGTPKGVILGRPEAEQSWLKAGDVVEVTIEKIGTMTNTLVDYE